MDEKLEEIRKRIIQEKPKPMLTINRIPQNTIRRFKELANNDDFCEDYGMVIKYLIDFHDGVLGSGTEHLEMILQDVMERLSIVEGKCNLGNDNTPTSQEKKMADGSTRLMKNAS